MTRRILLVLLIPLALMAGSVRSMDKKEKKASVPQPAKVAASVANIRNAGSLAGIRPSAPGVWRRGTLTTSMLATPLLLSGMQGASAPAAIAWNSAAGVPRLIVPSRDDQATAAASAAVLDPIERARTFLAENAALLRVDDPSVEFSGVSADRDELGMTHVRMKQLFKGIEVWGGDVYIHLAADGRVVMFNGNYRPTPRLSTTAPAIGADLAVSIVTSDLASSGSAEGVPPGLQSVLKYSGPTVREMIWYDDQKTPRLVWAVEARSGLKYDWQYLVDARSGAILDKFNTVCFDGPTTANAQDLNGVSRQVNTYLSGGTYYMLDAAEPMYNAGQSSIPQNPVGGIMGVDLQGHDLSAQSTIYFSTSTDNSWSDPSVISAHYNAAITYNYYRTVFGRNSIDDKGMTIYSIVHVTESGQPMDNAFWSSTVMCYGDGNTLFKPLAGGFDVAAHEMTHGVTQHSANLIYKDQSGALNESMSDVFASAVDSANWTIGEQVIKDFGTFPSGALRSMSDPHNGGSAGSAAWQPASMAEFVSTTQDNGGVHINSGIPNRAFYLTAATVGRGKASHIWYRALTNYLTSSAQFVDARIATETSAKDLFGAASAELTAVQSAWDAVGVSSGTATPPPTVPQLQGTDWVLVVNTDGADPNSIYMVRPVLQGNAGDFAPLSATSVGNRPAVSDTGGVVVFVDINHRLRALNASSSPGEGFIDTNSVWSSVAVGPGLSAIALTSIYADTSIYYFDLVAQTSKTFKVRTQSYDGSPAGTALYCDEMSFDPTGRYLLFDTYNQTQTTSGTIGFWNINLLDIATGQMQSVFPPQPAGTDIGNPSFSKSSGTRFVFDQLDNNAGTSMVMGADFFTGSYGAIVGPLVDIGYPTYSGDGSMIAYHAITSINFVYHDAIEQIGVNASGTGPSGSAMPYVLDATAPVWFVIGSRVTSVETGTEAVVPSSLQLMQNYPNPFNPSTRIRFALPASGPVRLEIYDVTGSLVRTLINGDLPAGSTEVTWDGMNDLGRAVASGMYLYRLTGGRSSVTRKMYILK